MKQKHMAALLREDLTTVAVYFEADIRARQGMEVVTKYDYLALRTDAAKLKPGDWLVVPSRNNDIKIAVIHEIHDEPNIDVDADFDYRFYIDVVDRQRYDAIVKHHEEFSKTLLAVEKTVKRESLVDRYKQALGASPRLSAKFEELRQGPALPAPAAPSSDTK